MKYIFPHENFHLIDFLRLFTGNLLSDYYHAWHDDNLWDRINEIFSFRLMQFWGTYQGFRQQGHLSIQLKQRFYYPNGLMRPQLSETDVAQTQRVIDYSSLPKETQVAKYY